MILIPTKYRRLERPSRHPNLFVFFASRALQSSSTQSLPTWIIPGLMHAEDHFLSYSSVWWRTSKTRFVLGPTEKDWSESKSRQIEAFPTSAPRLNYILNAQSGLKINQALLCGRDAYMSHGKNRKLKTCRRILNLGKHTEVQEFLVLNEGFFCSLNYVVQMSYNCRLSSQETSQVEIC